MNKLSIVLIITGFVIIVLPFIDDLIVKSRQEQLINEYETRVNNHSDVLENYKQVNSILSSNGDYNAPVPNYTQEEKDIDHDSEQLDSIDDNQKKERIPKVQGILRINKINLKLPIFYGTSQKELINGVGLVKGTAKIGQKGNMVLAGHRGRTFGRLFNRLNELVSGDEIVVDSEGNRFVYVVYNKEVVDPDDTHVLFGPKNEMTLTLITCHPLYETSHRLIIKARIVN
ncbi:MAG: sortase [Mahellales bacterium]|jgi:sortase A